MSNRSLVNEDKNDPILTDREFAKLGSLLTSPQKREVLIFALGMVFEYSRLNEKKMSENT